MSESVKTPEMSDTTNVVYDIFDPKYLNEESLRAETNRSMTICEGCRLCFKYCSVFPNMFDLIEGTAGNDIAELNSKALDGPMGECFQCKLCYVKCPYTADDNHEYDLNLPALFTRWQAVRGKRKKKLRDKLLANPALVGRLGGLFPALFNWLNRNPVNRKMMELTIGIAAKKDLPKVFGKTFLKRFRKTEQHIVGPDQDREDVVLFPTCYVNWNNPEIGEDAVFVLNQNNMSVSCETGNCCGAPQLDLPDFDKARKWAKNIIDTYSDDIEKGKKIVVLNPTCSMTMKKEYPELFPPGETREKAKKLSVLVKDLHEYLWEKKQEDKFNRDFKSTPGGTDYHIPCHLRAQQIGFRSRDIMKLIPENKITLNQECSCHDGTFAFKKEFFDISMQYGKNAFEGIKEKPNAQKASDCPLAAGQLKQGAGLEETPLHPVQVVARAYKADGFPKKVEPASE